MVYGLLPERLSPLFKSVLGTRFSSFTRVQLEAFDSILAGENVVLCSETGSGKTEAALIPTMQRVVDSKGEKGTRILYITPLRALNRDIEHRIKDLAQAIGLSLETRHGDTTKVRRAEIRANPPELLVTTPETFQALITEPLNLRGLSNLSSIIIDEANELLQSKRGSQLLLAIRRLESYLAKPIQKVCLSATIKSGRVVCEFFLAGSGRVIYLDSSRVYDVSVDACERPNDIKSATETIAQHLDVRSIVFTNTRQMAEGLAKTLPETNVAGSGIAVHHSSLSVTERLSVEERLRQGKLLAVVATSSLELGIDIGVIDQVIQVGSPKTVETLAQRFGRSGHFFERTSKGLFVALNPLDLLEGLVVCRLLRKRWLERPVIFTKPLDVLSHQIAGHLLVVRHAKLDDVYQLITGAYPYRSLTRDELMDTLNHLSTIGAAKVDGEAVRASWRTKSYFYTHLSTIVTNRQFAVVNVVTRSKMGYLDPSFVERFCENGKIIMLGRRPWEIISIDYGTYNVNVRPGPAASAAVPTWAGDVLPVDDYVAKGMYDLIRSSRRRRVVKGLKLFPRAVNSLRAVPSVPTLSHSVLVLVPDSAQPNVLLAIAPLGTRGNRGLALLIEEMLSGRLAEPTTYVSSICVLVKSSYSINCGELARDLGSISADAARKMIINGVLKYGKFTDRLFKVAERLGFDTEHMIEKMGPRRTHAILSHTLAGKELVKEVLDELVDLPELCRLVGSRKVHVAVRGTAEWKLGGALMQSMRVEGSDQGGSYIIEAARVRLTRKMYQVVCLSCFKYSSIRRLSEIGPFFKCPKCGSLYLAFVSPSRPHMDQAIASLRRGEVSADPEVASLEKELTDSASIYLDYGPRGILVLSGFGVGPRTAKKILRKRVVDENQLIVEILKAEQDFIRTKEFWIR
ncbi:MAG: DEAD/DEAH box helicase [Candidatus Marsarchaeota archaeon]|nr:DEAD/DEAH box helicase [Candidatus Marsarchaeota archaeon]